MQEVAARSGLSLWALRYSFESGDALFRDVVSDLLRSVSAQCRYSKRVGSSVSGVIRDFADFSAALVSTAEYRDMLFLVLRYGRHQSWLERAYQQDIVHKLRDELEQAVLRTSQMNGQHVVFREGATRRFHSTIEAEFGLAPLLHVECEHSAESGERTLRGVAAEAFRATYLFEWDSASAA